MINSLVKLLEHGRMEEEPDAMGEEKVGLSCQDNDFVQVVLFSGCFLVSF